MPRFARGPIAASNGQADALGMLFPHDPHDPPRFLARTPHGYHDVALIREDLSSAG